jgi:hypothetical protein
MGSKATNLFGEQILLNAHLPIANWCAGPVS